MAHLLVTTIARVKDSGSLVCAPKLLRVVPDLLATTFVAGLSNGCFRTEIVFCKGLHLRPLRPQRRWKVAGFRSRHYDL